jgi:TPR repeat protein
MLFLLSAYKKVLFLALTFLVVTIDYSASQDINSGITAYERGDYAIALKNFMPLADIDTDYTQLRISENYQTINPLAQYYLGLMYCMGMGVSRDVARSQNYFSEARRGGNSLAEIADCN